MKNNLYPTEHTGPVTSRAIQLLVRSWAAVQGLERRHINQKSFAAYCGIGETAYSNWTAGATELTQIEALLRTMERIPEPSRQDLFRGLLRQCPWLESPTIGHDPLAVHALRGLARRRSGMCIVQSEREFPGSYVLTAIAHAATQLGSSIRKLSGFDFASGEAFVPVAGVTYADATTSGKALRELVRSKWPSQSITGTVLLNRVLSRLPEMQKQFLGYDSHQHLLIGEGTDFDLEQLRRVTAPNSPPAIVVQVSELTGNRFGLSFSQLQQS